MLALLKGRRWAGTGAPDASLVSNRLPVSKWHSFPPSLGRFPEVSQELRGQWCFTVASPWPHVYITPNWANLQPLTLKIIFSYANRAVIIHIHMELQNR